MPAQFSDLAGRRVWITGGAGGIGAALVQAFCDQGASVACFDRDVTAIGQLRRDLGDRAGQVSWHEVDLCDENAFVQAMQEADRAQGPAQVLIANAGWDPRYRLEDMTVSEWEQLFRLNVGHAFVAARQVIPAMRQAGSGCILVTSSCQIRLGQARLACYTATKAALAGFVKSLAREVGPSRIRVNAVAPGWVLTSRQLAEHIDEATLDRLLNEWQALPDPIRPEDLAPTYLYLASDTASRITGQVLEVDAGLMMP